MSLILTIENEERLPDGGPTRMTVSRRGLDIGRDQYLDWTLTDPSRYISGKHCEIRFSDGDYWLHDVSTNGTFVNGSDRRLPAPHRIRTGDRIMIGHYIIRAEVEGAPAGAPEPAAAPASGNLWTPVGEAAPPADRSLFEPPRPAGPAFPDVLDRAASIPPPVMPPLPPAFGAATPGAEAWLAPPPAAPSPWDVPPPPAAPVPNAWMTPPARSPWDASVAAETAGVAPAPAGLQPEPPAAPPMPSFEAAPPAPPPPPAVVAPEAAPAAEPTDPGWAAEPPVAWGTEPTPGWAAEPAPAPAAPPAATSFAPPPLPPSDRPSGIGAPVTAAAGASGIAAPDQPPYPQIRPAAPTPPQPMAPPMAASTPAPPAGPGSTAGAGGREILNRIAAAAGIPPAVVAARDEGELADEIGASLRLVAENLMQLLAARAETKSVLRSSERTMIQAIGNNPLKFSPTAEDALRIIYGGSTRSYLDYRRTFEESFADLKTHQVSTTAAMQAALEELFQELAPDQIDKSVEGGGGLLGSRKAKLWDTYVERWRARTRRSDGRLVDSFMQIFAECYDKLQRKGR